MAAHKSTTLIFIGLVILAIQASLGSGLENWSEQFTAIPPAAGFSSYVAQIPEALTVGTDGVNSYLLVPTLCDGTDEPSDIVVSILLALFRF